jgi:hypothetical protein
VFPHNLATHPLVAAVTKLFSWRHHPTSWPKRSTIIKTFVVLKKRKKRRPLLSSYVSWGSCHVIDFHGQHAPKTYQLPVKSEKSKHFKWTQRNIFFFSFVFDSFEAGKSGDLQQGRGVPALRSPASELPLCLGCCQKLSDFSSSS